MALLLKFTHGVGYTIISFFLLHSGNMVSPVPAALVVRHLTCLGFGIKQDVCPNPVQVKLDSVAFEIVLLF